MPSSERGWYLVWDKLLLQTKWPLPSLLKSPLVLVGLTLWGVISNLGIKRRWWKGVGRDADTNSVSCPQHITYCLETLPGRDCMNLLFKADLVKLNISGSSLPRGELKNTCRAALNYWGIKNILKAVRIVHAGKGSSDFRNSRKLRVSYSNRICCIPCWTFRLKRCRRGPRVPVCMCVSGYKSVDQFLQHWCVHFWWLASWMWPRRGVEWEKHRLWSPRCHLLCMQLSLSSGFHPHRTKTFARSLQNCEE